MAVARPAGKVLLLSVSSGAGHLRAADALKKAFEREGSASSVVHHDVLKYSTAFMRGLYAKSYLKLVDIAPELIGWAYKRTDRPWKYMRRRTTFDRLNLRGMVRLIEAEQPSLIVCTHFTPAEVVSWLKAKRRIRCPHAVIVTDMDAHGMWMVPRCDRYFVAREETAVYLASQRVAASKIRVTGIPIDPVFERPGDRRSARRKFGLSGPAPVILVSAGGFGVGPVERMFESLRAMRHPAWVVALCGRNESLRRKLLRFSRSSGSVRFRATGYTTEIHDWMAASDVLLGKPGGLTTSEALARGLAFCVVAPIPGQEERNSDVLLEEGCGIRCNNLPALGWKLDRLLGDPARLAAMRRNARRIARPRAARDIVRETLALIR